MGNTNENNVGSGKSRNNTSKANGPVVKSAEVPSHLFEGTSPVYMGWKKVPLTYPDTFGKTHDQFIQAMEEWDWPQEVIDHNRKVWKKWLPTKSKKKKSDG